MAIKVRAKHAAKVVLGRAGTRAPARLVRALTLANGYFSIGHWLAANEFDTSKTVSGGRTAVFQVVADRISSLQVLYLEFGVFEGSSLRFWSAALKNPESQLHGFDSFRGLPETFDGHSHPMGLFDRGGKPPAIDDRRIVYHVGLFEETLPTFQVPDHEQLLITLDADLYSSTRLALECLAPAIHPGAIVYFDELSRVDHEPAAFRDFMSKHLRRFEVLALDDTFNTGAFICTA